MWTIPLFFAHVQDSGFPLLIFLSTWRVYEPCGILVNQAIEFTTLGPAPTSCLIHEANWQISHMPRRTSFNGRPFSHGPTRNSP